jgi:hypothetical protein
LNGKYHTFLHKIKGLPDSLFTPFYISMILDSIVGSKTIRRSGDGYKDQNPDDEMANTASDA